MYIKPEMEVIELSFHDVVATSDPNFDYEEEGDGEQDDLGIF